MEAIESMVQRSLEECVLVLCESVDHSKRCKLLLSSINHSRQIRERFVAELSLHVTILTVDEFPRDFESADHDFSCEPFFKLVELMLIVLEVERFKISNVSLFGFNIFRGLVLDIFQLCGLLLKLLLAHSHLAFCI